MHNIGRIVLFLGLLTSLTAIKSYSQLIEKAPPSPVTVTAPVTDSVNATVEIFEVILTGFKRTKPYIIEREVPFKKGDTVKSTDLQAKLTQCKQQLMYTSLFVDVEVQAIKVNEGSIYVLINVKERWYLFPIPYFNIVSRNFNTWWVEENHSFNRVEYGLKFMQNNVTGRNDNLNLWFISGFTQQVSLRYENPGIDRKLQHGINVGFGFRRNRELNIGMDPDNPNKLKFYKDLDKFIINQHYVDFTYTYRPAIKTRHSIRVSYANIGINDTVVKQNPYYFNASANRVKYGDISYNLSYINVDYIPYPLKGFTGDANVYQRFGRNSHYSQLSLRGNYNFKALPKTYVQLQAVTMLRFPFDQPYISNNFMGSANTYMRGLEYYVVEGVAGGIGRATLKNEVVSFNLRSPLKSKTHDKIPFRIFLKTFGDLGYSYAKNYSPSRLNNKLLYTWGAGIDIVTFYDIVLRFEYSYNQLGDRALFFHNQNDW